MHARARTRDPGLARITTLSRRPADVRVGSSCKRWPCHEPVMSEAVSVSRSLVGPWVPSRMHAAGTDNCHLAVIWCLVHRPRRPGPSSSCCHSSSLLRGERSPYECRVEMPLVAHVVAPPVPVPPGVDALCVAQARRAQKPQCFIPRSPVGIPSRLELLLNKGGRTTCARILSIN